MTENQYQPPTREQIVAVLRDHLPHLSHVPALFQGIAGAILAQSQQPTPSAEPEREPCTAETHSWDHFRSTQVDSYWIRCTKWGEHEEHEDSNTGLTWRDPSTIRDVTPPPATPEADR